MGCQLSLSRNCQEQQQPPSRGELRFCSGDLLDIQILLWNVLIIYSGDEKTRNHKGISKAIKIIRQSSTDIGYDIPTDEDLASRLLTDAVERESQLDDLHIVHKLETEQEVIALVMHTDSTPLLKPAALEILCQWYVESEDCNNMIDLVSSSPIQFPVASSIPQGTDFQKSSCCESYQSFAWEPSSVDNIASGSLHGVDMNSFQSDCKSSTSVQRQRSSSTATAASITGGYQPSSFIREIVTSSQLRPTLQQLSFCLRGALRTALRRYSMSHYDEETREQKSTSQRLAGSEWSKNRAMAIQRCESLSNHEGGLLRPVTEQYSLTVVLDLDETLVYAREGPLWVRPGITEFLHNLRKLNCEVVAWTASNRSYAGGILSRLDPFGDTISQCIYSHPKWLRSKGRGPQVKDLQLIGRDLQRTVIIDNLPDAIMEHPANAIVVENYEGYQLQDVHDLTLSTLTEVITDIVLCGKSVPSFLRDHIQTKNRGYLRYTERRLATPGKTVWCYMLNSEPSRFDLSL